MIQLFVANYCQQCAYFKPDIEKGEYTVDDEWLADTTIRCKYRSKCKKIYEQVVRDMAKEIEIEEEEREDK